MRTKEPPPPWQKKWKRKLPKKVRIPRPASTLEHAAVIIQTVEQQLHEANSRLMAYRELADVIRHGDRAQLVSALQKIEDRDRVVPWKHYAPEFRRYIMRKHNQLSDTAYHRLLRYYDVTPAAVQRWEYSQKRNGHPGKYRPPDPWVGRMIDTMPDRREAEEYVKEIATKIKHARKRIDSHQKTIVHDLEVALNRQRVDVHQPSLETTWLDVKEKEGETI